MCCKATQGTRSSERVHVEIATEHSWDDRNEVKEERMLGSHTHDYRALIHRSLFPTFRLFTLVSVSRSSGVLRQRRYFTSAGLSEDNAYARDRLSATFKYQPYSRSLTSASLLF